MTAPALRIIPFMDDVRDHVDDVRDRVTTMPNVALPRFQEVGRQADQTLDRVLGRPARSSRFKPLLVIGVVGIIATLTAMAMSWTRGRAGRLAAADIDAAAGDPMSGLAGSGTATIFETDRIGLGDQQADVH